MLKLRLNLKSWCGALLVTMVAYFFKKQIDSYHDRRVLPTLGISSTHVNEKLLKHSGEFNVSQILQVTDGVWVAIGYALANCIIIECNNSLTIIDTTESLKAATQIREDFARSYPFPANKPVKHVIYTHYHHDHTGGTISFVDDKDNPPTVISHPDTNKELQRALSVTTQILYKRAMRQFGSLLHDEQTQTAASHMMHFHDHSHDIPHSHHHFHESQHEHDPEVSVVSDHRKHPMPKSVDSEFVAHPGMIDSPDEIAMQRAAREGYDMFVNSGIGPFCWLQDPFDRGVLYPTLELTDPITHLDLDGVEFSFYHAPGETADQIFIYLPEKGVLFPGDNIYRAFPNLYAIRGTPPRPVKKWVESLDAMRALEPRPRFLVPSHTRPVEGQGFIHELLTVYRDCISFVHDQTVRYINLGYHPSDIVPIIRQSMPHRLKDHPYLQEFYGTIDWSVRGIFVSYLGWFSGDAADLFPLSKTQRGARLIKIVGSVDKLLEIARENVGEQRTRDDCQWGLEVITEILAFQNPKVSIDEDIYDHHKDEFVNVLNGREFQMTPQQVQDAKNIQVQALKCMAGYMTSANGRNYFLTTALEIVRDKPIIPTAQDRKWLAHTVPLRHVFEMFPVRYRVMDRQDWNRTTCFDFPDIQQFFIFEFRDGVVELRDDEYRENDNVLVIERCDEMADLVVEMVSQDFRTILSGEGIAAMMYANGQIVLRKGSILEFAQFRSHFEFEARD